MITEMGGKKISPLGLGTYGVGGRNSADSTHDSEHVEAVKFAIENGINFIDTAEMYSAGHSEELVGRAIKSFPREDVFVTTKVWNDHLKHDDLIKAAKASLKRLDTDYIDLYLIHWPNPKVPIKESIKAMEELADQGLVRSIGVSNFSVKQVSEAIESASKYKIEANQIQYSLASRDCENDVVPFCEKNGVKIIAYTPINRGKLDSVRNLADISGKLGKSGVSIALNYLMKRSLPIPKSVNKDHILEFTEAMKYELSDEDYKQLKS